MDTLFNETVRYSLVNSYASTITRLHAWQQSQASADDKTPPLRGAKLTAILDSVRRDEDKCRMRNAANMGEGFSGNIYVEEENAYKRLREEIANAPGRELCESLQACETLLGRKTILALRFQETFFPRGLLMVTLSTMTSESAALENCVVCSLL
jgi:hypothetical protein